MQRLVARLVASLLYSLVLLVVAALTVVYAAFVLVLVPLPMALVRRVAAWLGWDRGDGKAKSRDDRGWVNSVGNQFSTPRAVIPVASRAELVAAVQRAGAEGRRIRALGSGHSFSDVAVGDDLLIEPHGMDQMLTLDRAVLRAPHREATLVQVESGITLRELNRRLDERHLALINMGAYDAQTLAGVIATATHGSGHGLGAVCDFVRSVELVREDGRLMRLEPSDGITDPVAYAAKYADGPALVQEDQLFHSAVVSMGSMGIAYSYVLEVRPAYLLAETRELVRWEDLKQKLRARDFQPSDPELEDVEIRHFEFLVNPYPRRAGRPERECLVTYRWIATDQPSDKGARTRNPVMTFITGMRVFDWVVALVLSRYPRVTRLLLGSALRSLVDRRYVAKSFVVLNLGAANHVPAYSQELAFSAEPRPGADPQYLDALERLFVLAEQQARHGRWHTVPVSVRFIKASPHYLAMSHGRATAIFEIGMLADVPGGWELLRYYERVLCRELDGRPHWGQANFILGPDRVSRAYPGFGAWLRAYARLCPAGRFENAFTERLGLRTLVEAMKAGWSPP
jgi:FAD/FMN-containing dehydrogenase